MHVKPFSKSTYSYEKNASVQKQSATDLWALFDSHVQPNLDVASVLDLGSGIGLCAEQAAMRYPLAEYLLNDVIEEPLMLAKLRMKGCRTKVSLCDLKESIASQPHWDLVTSNFALQWVDNPINTLEKIVSCSDIAVIAWPIEGSLEQWGNIAPMAHLPYLSLIELQDFLSQLETCKRVYLSIKKYPLVFPTLIDFLRSMHGLGAIISPQALGGSALRKLIQKYNKTPWVDNYNVASLIVFQDK